MTRRTRASVFGLTRSPPLMTRETVVLPTPACRATSLRVGSLLFFIACQRNRGGVAYEESTLMVGAYAFHPASRAQVAFIIMAQDLTGAVVTGLHFLSRRGFLG